MGEVLKRSQVPVSDTWNLNDLFHTQQDWETAYAQVDANVARLGGYQGRLGERAALKEALDLLTDTEVLLGRVYSYAARNLDVDNANSEYQALSARAQSLYVRFAEKISFIQPELLAQSEEYLAAMRDDASMSAYRMMLDNLARSRAHTLSAEMEQLVAMTGEMGNSPDNIYSMLNTLDMKFPAVKNEAGEKVALTHAGFIPLMKSHKKKVRRAAFEGVYGTYQKFENTFPAIYQASVQSDVFYARAGKFASSLEAKLFPDNVPLSLYDNLIAAVHRHVGGLNRFVSLNARLNGIKHPSMIDVYVPPRLGFDISLDFRDAYALVVDCLRPLGEDYQAVLRQALDERWIDPFENDGKRSGAYSADAYGVHPFVLMNYKPDLNHLLTIAHEMGHAMHSYLSNARQPAAMADYSLFVAEVASTVNEVLVLLELMQRHPEGEAFLLYTLLDSFRNTLFRQTLFAEFERESHRMAEAGEPLTAQSLNAVYARLNAEYYTSLEQPELLAYEWMRIPHFYRSFYVYKYATGFSAAMAIATKIRQEGAPMVKKYKDFLSAGGSLYPIDALKLADVDMSTGEPVERALQEFETLLGRYEKIAKKQSAD
ncbi:MAG TPA: oligoendopeptidase F [Candidatus Alectryocaccomicrobium excrementavium]|uniref:Oligopeptidase F n=1 Tax=Candidatus Alectryocaccomicrobium excrementavium TaxID=2840668 RepID=A0A9D1G0P8_9FIRM|nr:oligoendopeptidase F [Candidatus Alectryocaccomicrobium excrementavium]